MSEKKLYTVEGFEGEFEFQPDGSPLVGTLQATVKDQTFRSRVDLEKLGSRAAWAKEAADLYPKIFEAVSLKRALNELSIKREEEVEAAERAGQDEDSPTSAGAPEPGTERHERAVKLLRNRRLLARVAVDMKRLGHVGEHLIKQLAFICAVSANAGTPIQPSTHAQSSAGKNALWDTTLSLLPEEMVIRRSGITAKALFRTKTDLKGAVLYIQEVTGSEDANYTIRVLQSDGRLEYESTEKMPDGTLSTVTYTTEGPTVVVQTTTKNHLHPENETRILPIYIDESEEQTERIVESILKNAAGKGTKKEEQEAIRNRWHDAIRLLEPASVVIPYADRIRMPRAPLRLRRDAGRLVDVIRVVAWVHQHQRERDEEGQIIATEDDFHAALALISDSLKRAWQALTPAEEAVLEAIKKLPEDKRTRGFKRRDLNVRGFSEARVKQILNSLSSTGYLDCDGRSGPQGYTYTMAREAEGVSLGISLSRLSDSEENPANGVKNVGQPATIRNYPVADSEDEGEEDRLSDSTGQNGNYLLKDEDLQGKRSTRQSDNKDRLPPTPDDFVTSSERNGSFVGGAEDPRVSKALEAITTPGSGPAKTFELFRKGRISDLDSVAGAVSAHYDEGGWKEWAEPVAQAYEILVEGTER